MEVLLTPGARALLDSQMDDPATLTLIGKAMNFEDSFSYRQHKALAAVHPYLKPVICLHNGILGLRHLVAEGKVMLFIPPAVSNDMHEAFFEKELATCTQMQIA